MKSSLFAVAGQHIFTGAKYLTGWATVVSGTAIAADILQEVARRTVPAQEPIVAGATDTLMGIVDPADIFGYRKKKEDKLKDKAARSEMNAKEEREARKIAEAKLSEAQKVAANAQKMAAANSAKATRLDSEGKGAEADRIRKLERAQERLALLTRSLVSKGRQAAAQPSDISKALDIANKAVATAQQAQNPIMSTVQAMSQAPDDASRSVVADVYDSVHREGEPDYEALVQRLTEGDGAAFLELPTEDFSGIEGAIAGIDYYGPKGLCTMCSVRISGSCCSSCATGLSSVLSGDDDDDVSGSDDDDDDDEDDVSGDDDSEVSGMFDDDDDDISGDDDDVSGFDPITAFEDDDEDDDVLDELGRWG